jgi:NAD-dependent DNA ligase
MTTKTIKTSPLAPGAPLPSAVGTATNLSPVPENNKWVQHLVVANTRHDAEESSLTGNTNTRGYRSRLSIPAGTVVMVLRETPQTIIYMFKDSAWESTKTAFEICQSSDSLLGKTFCFTGALDKPRDYFEALVTLHGGEFKKTVTDDLQYLVMGFKNSHSRKALAAKAKGIICLEEDGLWKLIEQGKQKKAQETALTSSGTVGQG